MRWTVGATGLGLVLGPAHVGLAVGGLALAARLLKCLDRALLGRHAHQPVADAARQLGGLAAGGGHVDERELLGQRVDAGVVDRIEAAFVTLHAALPQLADDLHGLLQHGEADVGRRPVVTEDVLVEVLAGAHAEEEASRHHRRRRGRGLGDHRGVDAHGGTGDAGAEAQPLGGVGDAADDAPYERALALGVGPRVIVVGHEGELEACVLGCRREADEIVG